MSLTVSLMTTSRMQQCFNVMWILVFTKCFSIPVSLFYSVGNKTYYYYYYVLIHLFTIRIGNFTSGIYQASKTSRSWLRQQGVKLHIYLDDWLICSESPEQAQLHYEMTITLLQRLGWVSRSPIWHPARTSSFSECSSTLDNSQWRPSRKCLSRSSQFISTGWPTLSSQPAICTGCWVWWCLWQHWYIVEGCASDQSSGGLPQHDARGPGTGLTGSQFLSEFCRKWPGGLIISSSPARSNSGWGARLGSC